MSKNELSGYSSGLGFGLLVGHLKRSKSLACVPESETAAQLKKWLSEMVATDLFMRWMNDFVTYPAEARRYEHRHIFAATFTNEDGHEMTSRFDLSNIIIGTRAGNLEAARMFYIDEEAMDLHESIYGREAWVCCTLLDGLDESLRVTENDTKESILIRLNEHLNGKLSRVKLQNVTYRTNEQAQKLITDLSLFEEFASYVPEYRIRNQNKAISKAAKRIAKII